jgi:glycosyltransferase involved in cell wall biosynthesis
LQGIKTEDGRLAAAKPRVAITHNWLSVRGGSERVLFEFHKLYPEAPIYTLVYQKGLFPELKDAKVRTSWLQQFPGLRSHHEFFPPLRYLIWRNARLKGFDIVLSSSSSENKAVRVQRGTLHIAYIHTPPHYYWRYFDEYLKHPGFGPLDPLARLGLRLLNPLLRRLDRKAAQNPTLLLANSKFIQSQIREYYGRDSTVLYPPVDTERFAGDKKASRQPYFLVFGRQTVFKRIDLVIDAFNQLGLPLIVAGDGPEHDNLVKMAGPSIEFQTDVNDDALTTLVQEAQATVFANEEDFGITWVESMAAGTPVICYGSGGALETVIDGKTGVLFHEQTADIICAAIIRFQEKKWDYEAIAIHAGQFSVSVFDSKLRKLLDNEYKSFKAKEAHE